MPIERDFNFKIKVLKYFLIQTANNKNCQKTSIKDMV